ncbi:MAG TPA: ATP-dependent DNA helicase UvrD2, partial [Actinomycetota bacterium]
RPDAILEPLNPAQRDAAAATKGPVAILAGAGTGKTTTITHRIAYQVESGAFSPGQILAVTFTEKAAGELKARLARLGVEGVEARTFHSAALSQLSRLLPKHAGTAVGEILDAKTPLIASLANGLPPPHKFIPRRDLATEIEWAKNRMVSPGRYLDEVETTGHTPPIPAQLMARVYEGYERRKERTGRIDFEDMLGLAVRLFDEHDEAAREIRDRYHALTVDEYQDVNPLQQALLDRWLGGREELCVVGDDYQTIYGFTGASPAYLLGFERRFPGARLIRLEENYRSTPEVLDVANRLTDRLGGYEKILTPTRPSGPPPVVRPMLGDAAEAAFVVEEVRRLHTSEGVPHEEMAVLYRVNARSERFEEALAGAGIPFQVRDGAFLRRPGPRAALARLRRGAGQVFEEVERATAALGFDPDTEPDSEEEVTRQSDLARLRALALEFAESHPDGSLQEFLEELVRRFSVERTGRGVNLMTYHRAKGLEFDAVFLPRLLDGEIPFRSGRSRAPVDEERRLLYVGITRAKRFLFLTWPADARTSRSPFLVEMGLGLPEPERPVRAVSGDGPAAKAAPPTGDPLFDALRRWRRDRAAGDGVPAYVVFHDSTLAEIASRRPRTLADLRTIGGVGPTKLERYGEDVLDVVREA